ncbi:MAG TPA: hypothetical protein V6C65_41895 [Allocoleopsis sp.]
MACPVFVVLHAISLVVPVYALLLAVGLGMLYLRLRPARGLLFEEVFGLLAVLIGAACSIVGFALSPLPVQLLATIALVVFSRRYQVNVKAG